MPSCCICRATIASWESKNNNVRLHVFPKKAPRIVQEWKKFAGIPENEDVENKRMCTKHFRKEDVIHQALKIQLRLHAIPCFFPPENPPLCPPLSKELEEPLNLKLEDSDWDEQETGLDAWHEEPHFSESAFLDHDYLATVKPNEQQKLGGPTDTKGALCNQMVLQDVRKELCRLCGQKGTLLRPIFDSSSSGTDENVSLSTKIEMYLPFKVKMDDPLPCHICSQCFEVLNRWHELYVTCMAADAVLWKTFGGQCDVSSQNYRDLSTNRDQDSIHCSDNSDPSIDAENYEDSTTVPADCSLNETKEDCEVSCSVCGMITSSRPPKEEDLLIAEFKNFYSRILSVKYKCTYCYEFFLNPRAKKEHLKNCRELSTVCEICGKDDVSRKDLQKHKYVKHQQVIVKRFCDKCGRYFKSLSALNKHINVVHEQGLSPKVCCHLCCSTFVDEQNYRIHQKKHEKGIIKTKFRIEEHLGGEGVYVCPVCEEVFNDTLSFVVHLNSKKDLKCLSCQKQITSEKRFMLHVCGEWNCRYCPKICKTKIQWIVHERLHTGEKPINCRVCDKSFRSFQLRTRHETTHAPSLQCSICGKNFRNKYVFQDHLQCHEGKVFLCPVCHKGFSARKNVRKHMGTFHKGIRAKIV